MGLREHLMDEPVSSLDLRQLLVVRADTSVHDAVAVMRASHLGCVVVLDEAGKPLGQFTEKVLTRLLADGADLEQPIEPVLNPDVACVRINQPIHDVMDQLAEDHRYVVVLDENGRAIGLTGQKGVMEYIADHFPRHVKSQLMEARLYLEHREGA